MFRCTTSAEGGRWSPAHQYKSKVNLHLDMCQVHRGIWVHLTHIPIFFFFLLSRCFVPVFFFFFKVFIYFILLALRVFVAVCGLSLVVASGGYSSLWSMGSSLWWHLLAWSTGSRHASFSSCSSLDSREQAQGLNCSTACEIFPDQGLNPVSCIAKWILNHWITREAPTSHFLN